MSKPAKRFIVDRGPSKSSLKHPPSLKRCRIWRRVSRVADGFHLPHPNCNPSQSNRLTIGSMLPLKFDIRIQEIGKNFKRAIESNLYFSNTILFFAVEDNKVGGGLYLSALPSLCQVIRRMTSRKE